MKLPLIKNFKSTTVWKAFTLNAIASAIIIVLSLVTKDGLDKYITPDGEEVTHKQPWYSIIVTALVAFASAFVAFTILHFVTGYGGGMLVAPQNK
jgi:hypothetical protein